MDWAAPFRIDWQSIYDMGVTTVVVYGFIIVAVRILGVRSISHMNNFDWMVIVAIGAISGSSIATEAVTASHAVVAIGMLFAAQYGVTWAASHSRIAADLLKANPSLLVSDGVVDHRALSEHRLTEQELLEEVRSKGLDGFEEAKKVVLESDSTVSVVPYDDGGSAKNVALQDVDDA